MIDEIIKELERLRLYADNEIDRLNVPASGNISADLRDMADMAQYRGMATLANHMLQFIKERNLGFNPYQE